MRRAATAAALPAMLTLALAGPAQAQTKGPTQGPAPPQRIISLNLCTDQLLIDLAPPERIVGLSPYAPATGIAPALSGTAEEVLLLRPGLVVSGRFMKRSTADVIRAQGIALEELDFVRSIAEVKAQIRRFGAITGAQEKAEARIAELDAALAELRAAGVGAGAGAPLSVLPYARRGWTAGETSLMGDLMREAGLTNAAAKLGLKAGGFVRLEQLVALKPDALLMAEDEPTAEDQGKAMLLHPALAGLFPPERRILIPERLAHCGGPALIGAIRSLARQVSRLKDLPAR
jgi:iron complex transport system substrate-binding protein